MKAKTIIILVISGGLLLFAGTFAFYIADGGKVLYRYPYGGHWRCYNIIVPIDQEETAKEIFTLNFTFDMTQELEVTFEGGSPYGDYKVFWKTDTGGPTGTVIGEMYLVSFSLTLKGSIRYSFPSEEPYVDFTEEELLERLTKEIESRITKGTKFQVRNFFGNSPWGEEHGKLKALPQRTK